MASTSEVGHNKNVANFKSVCLILAEMGALYNPSNNVIKLQALKPINDILKATIQDLNEKIPIYKNAVAARETDIKPLSKLSTRVHNSFRATQASQADKENMLAIVKKIRGDKKPKKVNPETADKETISTSQMSYDSRIANFDIMVNFIASQHIYEPNEEDLQVVSLKTYQQRLERLSIAVNEASNGILTARTARNNALYNGENNIISLANSIKDYLKSLGDPGNPYYKAVVRLKFKNQ